MSESNNNISLAVEAGLTPVCGAFTDNLPIHLVLETLELHTFTCISSQLALVCLFHCTLQFSVVVGSC
jgi:hypothetical protein